MDSAAQWAAEAGEGSDDEELAALAAPAADHDAEPADGGATFAGGAVDTAKVSAWKSARSAHYNEFRALQQARAAGLLDDEEEEEGEEGEEGEGEGKA